MQIFVLVNSRFHLIGLQVVKLLRLRQHFLNLIRMLRIVVSAAYYLFPVLVEVEHLDAMPQKSDEPLGLLHYSG